MPLSTLNIQLASSIMIKHTKGRTNYHRASFVSQRDDYKEDGEDATAVN